MTGRDGSTSPAEQAENRPMPTNPMHGKGHSDEGQDGGARAPPAMSHVAKGDALLTPPPRYSPG